MPQLFSKYSTFGHTMNTNPAYWSAYRNICSLSYNINSFAQLIQVWIETVKSHLESLNLKWNIYLSNKGCPRKYIHLETYKISFFLHTYLPFHQIIFIAYCFQIHEDKNEWSIFTQGHIWADIFTFLLGELSLNYFISKI